MRLIDVLYSTVMRTFFKLNFMAVVRIYHMYTKLSRLAGYNVFNLLNRFA